MRTTGSDPAVLSALTRARCIAPAPDPALMRVRCGKDVDEGELRAAHAHFAAATRTYPPLWMAEGEVRCALDETHLAHIQAYRSGAPHPLVAAHRDEVDAFVVAAGAALRGVPSAENGITAVPMKAIDPRAPDARDDATLATVLTAARGAPASVLGPAAAERLGAARAALMSYLALHAPARRPGLALAFVAASFEVGSRMGMPLAPAPLPAWEAAFGPGTPIAALARDAYVFQALMAHLHELVPGAGFEHQEQVLAFHEEAHAAMRAGTFGEWVPASVVAASRLGRRELSEKGLALAAYLSWDDESSPD